MSAVPAWHFFRQTIPVRYPLQLKEHRKRRNLTQGQLAEILGVEQPTVQRWEVGKRSPDLEQLGELADALGVTPGDLFKIPEIRTVGPRLFVKGRVAAGIWAEAYEWPQDEWREFTGRPDVSAKMEHRFGLEVIGDSMNLVYPHGTIVECVSLFGKAEALPGKRVVVIRQREDLQYEATVKKLTVVDGKLWAVPESTNPTFLPINLENPEPGVIETRIVAVVVGSYRPE